MPRAPMSIPISNRSTAFRRDSIYHGHGWPNLGNAMSEESGHWYRRDATPCHQVRKGDGGLRDFNLRWDRHLGALPSTTTVLNVIAKPQLNKWSEEQCILAALSFPKSRNDFATEKEFLAAIRSDAKKQVVDAANEGTRVHAAVEMHFGDHPYNHAYELHVNAVVTHLKIIFPQVNDWVNERTFVHRSGYAGTCDLHSPSTGIIADMKGKNGTFIQVDGEWLNIPNPADVTCEPKKIAYDQFWQLGSYQDGLQLPRAPGAAIFFSRTHPGQVGSHVWTADEMEEGAQIFHAALALHKKLKRYDGSF